MSIFVDFMKSYKNFNLTVQFETSEEILALLGASGSGKSLTLKCIAGIEKPDKGQIIVNGKTLFDSKNKINLPPQKRKVGFMFQNYALFPNMNVLENITSVVNKKHTDIDSIFKTLDIENIKELMPRQISGGQQQRVALARILAASPDIFMLDEPFSALDSHLRWNLEHELSGILRGQKKSTIYVSHDSEEAYRFSDKVAIIHKGSIVDFGEKKNVYRNPKTLPSALITGFKNISRIEKISDFKLKALDWGVEILSEKLVENDSKYIALDSKKIEFLDRKSARQNIFPITICKTIEQSQNMQILISIKEDENSFNKENTKSSVLQLETKTADLSELKYVYFPFNSMIFLK